LEKARKHRTTRKRTMSTGDLTTPQKNISNTASEYFNLVCNFENISPLRDPKTPEDKKENNENDDVARDDGDKKPRAEDSAKKETVESKPPWPVKLEQDWCVATSTNSLQETPSSLHTQQPEVVDGNNQTETAKQVTSTWKEKEEKKRE
jgi:hypothetical protein